MLNTMPNNFAEWLQAEIDRRGWNKSELARNADVTPTAISDVMNGRREVGPELATAIAKALKIKPLLVFQEAGLLPRDKNLSPEIEQIIHELQGMSKEEQQEYLSYLRYMQNRKKK